MVFDALILQSWLPLIFCSPLKLILVYCTDTLDSDTFCQEVTWSHYESIYSWTCLHHAWSFRQQHQKNIGQKEGSVFIEAEFLLGWLQEGGKRKQKKRMFCHVNINLLLLCFCNSFLWAFSPTKRIDKFLIYFAEEIVIY